MFTMLPSHWNTDLITLTKRGKGFKLDCYEIAGKIDHIDALVQQMFFAEFVKICETNMQFLTAPFCCIKITFVSTS